MNYVALPIAPLCSHCGQGGILLLVRSPCGCTLTVHAACQPFLRENCPLCRRATTRTEIVYQPDRKWILYFLGCIALFIATCIITWFVYKAF